MKYLFVLIGSLFFLNGCKQATDKTLDPGMIQNPNTLQSKDPNHKYPIMSFDTTSWNFGGVKAGDKVEHKFTFTNTGEVVLVITDVHASCGCTTTFYPKEPIAPGESSYINVKFDSHGKTGKQAKTVTVTANTFPNENILRIYAQIH